MSTTKKNLLRAAMLEIITKSPSLTVEAGKALRRFDVGSPVAESVARSMIRQALVANDMPQGDLLRLSQLLVEDGDGVREKRTIVLRFCVTAREAEIIRSMARQEADGSVSALIRQRLGIDPNPWEVV